MTVEQQSRMTYLVNELNRARKAYESDNIEIMSDFQYDKLYDELEELEAQTGECLSDSPTQTVGFDSKSGLRREKHPVPMLSQAKTKDVGILETFAGSRRCLLSRKMDGLTVVIYYDNGKLTKAVTRGNGHVGEVVTHAAKQFENLPKEIPYKGHLVMRGESLIRYSDFYKVNDLAKGKYANPRNLCSGSVRVKDARITAKRHVQWICFKIVAADGVNFHNSYEQSLLWAKSMGFDIVDYKTISDSEDVHDAVSWFETDVLTSDIPSDGLILAYDDIAYGDSLGSTGHNPRNSIAFKWKDETAETTLLDILLSVSKTGQINPIAYFEPVSLEGTIVRRASLHNVSILKSFRFGIGDRITVFKANMIIPQVAENLTQSNTYVLPDKCPACGGEAHVHVDPDSGVEVLFCENPDCIAKRITKLSHFTTRNAMNIMGLSDNQIRDLTDLHVLSTFADFYRLKDHPEIADMDGWGEKSYQNMLSAIEASRNAELPAFLYALSIPMIGSSTAKLIAKHFHNDADAVFHATSEELVQIDGIGTAIAQSFVLWISDKENQSVLQDLLQYVRFKADTASGGALDGMTVVITGKLTQFENRDALVRAIESAGGHVSGSVSSKTSMLVNNDVASTSGKNKKAMELGIPIMSEADFMTKFL